MQLLESRSVFFKEDIFSNYFLKDYAPEIQRRKVVTSPQKRNTVGAPMLKNLLELDKILGNVSGVDQYKVRMNNQAKILEITSHGALKGLKLNINNKYSNRIEMSFTVKESDLVLFDQKILVVKLIVDTQPLYVKFLSKNDFMLFAAKLKSNENLNIQYCELDSLSLKKTAQFQDKAISFKDEEYKVPSLKTERFDVFVLQYSKMGWSVKRFYKSLIIETTGQITIIGQADDSRVEFNLKEVQQILVNTQGSQNSSTITFTFDSMRPNISLCFEKGSECEYFIKRAQQVQIQQEGEQRKNMFIIKQSYNDKRKNREMRKYTWFDSRSTQRNRYNGIKLMQTASQIKTVKTVELPDIEEEKLSQDSEPFIFNLIENEEDEGTKEREEDVIHSGPNTILFKVILEEQGIERKKYLEVDYYEKKLSILKATNKIILIKLIDGWSYILTFSSIYKLFQFLEIFNFMQSAVSVIPSTTPLIHNFSADSIKTSPPQSLLVDTNIKQMRVLILTFNMNRKQQNLNFDKMIKNPNKYDLIIVGGQEAKMLQKTSLMIALANFLGSFQLMTITSVQMWEMFLIGFIKMQHSPFLKNVQVNYKATGYANIFGNKGGLQLSFSLHDHLFSFINVHLCHGNKRFEQRNIMMSDLIKHLKIQREEIDPDILADFSFILGDFNYRMETTYTELVPHMNDVLYNRKSLDQLHKAIVEFRKYPGYEEGEIRFLPTYKRSKVDDTFYNKKNQAPSYTDRILYKNNTLIPIDVHNYTSLEDVYGSDHRPVTLDFHLGLEPVRYMNLDKIINKEMSQKQSVGILSFQNLKLKNFNSSQIYSYLKKKFAFPSHLQISFYGDYLEAFSSSSEISIHNMARFYDPVCWENKDLPRCFTPINESELIRTRRLVILIWLTNEVCSQEVIGQVNLRLKILQRVENSKKELYIGKFCEEEVIIANNVVGAMDGEIHFEIVDSQKYSKTSEKENKTRRKTILKFTREHSV